MRWPAARVTRIGLSATQEPIDEVARLLVGVRGIDAEGNARCRIVDSGHKRHRDLAIELPDGPLEAVMSNEVWTQIYDRLAQLVREHRTTLVFVNTRRLSERVARHLSERLDTESVAAHHGSLARELRFNAEQRLKRGELKVLVATASLELGIDIGDVDLVCQLSSPRSINAFLQRVGRSGPRRGWNAEGSPVSAVARRSRGMHGAARQRATWRARSLEEFRSCRWTCCRSRSSPKLRRATAARASCSSCVATPIRIARSRASRSTSWCTCWPKDSRRGAAGTVRCCITMP